MAHGADVGGEQPAILAYRVRRLGIGIRPEDYAIAHVTDRAGYGVLMQFAIEAGVRAKHRLVRRAVAHRDGDALDLILERRVAIQAEPSGLGRFFHLGLELEVAERMRVRRRLPLAVNLLMADAALPSAERIETLGDRLIGQEIFPPIAEDFHLRGRLGGGNQ